MGETTGFLKWARELPTRRPVPVRLRDWHEVYEPFPRDDAADAGRALHGLRHPVLQQRLPARQPHPGLERPRLPRPLARRDRAAARHQQLPRVHRPAVPGAVRGRVRARHQRRTRSRSSRSRSRSSTAPGTRAGSRPVAAVGADRQAGRRRRLRARRAGRRAAAHAGRPRRRRVRAGRPHRRPAALRHPRVQDGEAPPRPPPRADARPRAPSSASNAERRRRRHRRRAARATSTRSCSPAAPPRGATCRSPAASSPASTRRWSTCRSSNRVQEGDLDEPPITADGQARRHHRRRRHRRRLPRHRAPPGRGVGAPVRDPAPAARRPRADANPWPT